MGLFEFSGGRICTDSFKRIKCGYEFECKFCLKIKQGKGGPTCDLLKEKARKLEHVSKDDLLDCAAEIAEGTSGDLKFECRFGVAPTKDSTSGFVPPALSLYKWWEPFEIGGGTTAYHGPGGTK